MPDADEKVGDAPAGTTAATRYKQLEAEREPYLRRARQAAALTIPTLLPPEGSNGNDLVDPFQSVGARGVNNLAAKLLLALFPPGSSFFRLAVDPLDMDELVALAASSGMAEDTARSEIEVALSEIERAVVGRMEQKGVRTTLFEGLKHLLVVGNVCLEILKDGAARLHFLDRYVVKRDTSGNVLEIVVRTRIAKSALPETVQAFLQTNPESESEPGDGENDDDEVDLYTWVQRDGKFWNVHQEAGGKEIPGTRGRDPLTKPRFSALRTTKIDGEDYGRSVVEDYLGDLSSLEGLSESIVEGAAAAARILVFVDEQGLTDPEDVSKAPNGAVIPGSAEDVTIFQLQKFADFSTAESTAVRIEKRLEQAFLLFSSIQRNAERVTAEEIRTVANELEQALGGLYSILAQELQRPLVDRVMHQMEKTGDLPALPSESVTPQIVAGLEGLSRSSDLTKLRTWATIMKETFGPEHVARYGNPIVFGNILASGLGLDIKGLVRTQDEVQAMQQAEAQRAIAEKAAPNAVKAAADVVTTQNQTPE